MTAHSRPRRCCTRWVWPGSARILAELQQLAGGLTPWAQPEAVERFLDLVGIESAGTTP